MTQKRTDIYTCDLCGKVEEGDAVFRPWNWKKVTMHAKLAAREGKDLEFDVCAGCWPTIPNPTLKREVHVSVFRGIWAKLFPKAAE